MRMLRFLLITILMVCPVCARIGETPEQCAKHYGEVVSKEIEGRIDYRKDALHTFCLFDEGKCVFVSHSVKGPLLGQQILVEISPVVREKMLALHSLEWKLTKENPIAKGDLEGLFETPNGTLIAEVTIYRVAVADTKYLQKRIDKTKENKLLEALDAMK
jgi:hypothetical protein